ncbi:hypothetical protein ACFPZD_12235 [Dyella tabacisoli]|uniref:Uncharacterized protein n=1 Tax=Dyella tabacisoli TaxID=2282381 RepID=A0A369UMX6_9GAMM|nr:hypothetical protein [Dyella tabacisoli]RDD81078.1 hypothetical protein DVJ77_14060 [Dyella tabacisoli]
MRLSDAYHVAADASADDLLDDAVTLLDYAYSVANAMSHSITENTEMDSHHIAGTFAALATFIDMAQSSSNHAQVQLRYARREAKSCAPSQPPPACRGRS